MTVQNCIGEEAAQIVLSKKPPPDENMDPQPEEERVYILGKYEIVPPIDVAFNGSEYFEKMYFAYDEEFSSNTEIITISIYGPEFLTLVLKLNIKLYPYF